MRKGRGVGGGTGAGLCVMRLKHGDMKAEKHIRDNDLRGIKAYSGRESNCSRDCCPDAADLCLNDPYREPGKVNVVTVPFCSAGIMHNA